MYVRPQQKNHWKASNISSWLPKILSLAHKAVCQYRALSAIMCNKLLSILHCTSIDERVTYCCAFSKSWMLSFSGWVRYSSSCSWTLGNTGGKPIGTWEQIVGRSSTKWHGSFKKGELPPSIYVYWPCHKMYVYVTIWQCHFMKSVKVMLLTPITTASAQEDGRFFREFFVRIRSHFASKHYQIQRICPHCNKWISCSM